MSLAAYAYFWGLGLVQAALVLFPRAPRSRLLAALRSHRLLLVGPAAAITAATFLPPVASGLADGLSTLALIAVPLLAARSGLAGLSVCTTRDSSSWSPPSSPWLGLTRAGRLARRPGLPSSR
jgi:hypothetical protein